ncbi:MAG: type II secretion system F family protein [Candidatus Staskawiczbacteria bacterium]|nr:type II secretion system F family protein [Candidatus Staskawiczbacteria bacterium]
MPNYFYTAKSFDGETESGNLNAQDEYQLAKIIKSKGLILIRSVPEEGKKKISFNTSFSFFPVSLGEKIMLIRNLGVMFSTGLSLVKSLEVLAKQTKHPTLKKALADIEKRVNKGENLSDALSKYHNIFPDLFVNMIKVGEESGTLEEIFEILSLQLQKEHELKSKIKNAMIYPAIIVLVMMIVGVVMVAFVIPNLKVFFESLNVDVPIYTKIIIGIGDFLAQKWYVAILGIILFITSAYFAIKTKLGKALLDTSLLRIPVISPIVKKSNSAFLIRSLSSMMSAGVPMLRALEIASKTVDNNYFKSAAIDAGEKIRKGLKLSVALKDHQDIFPFGVTEMVEIGEETGKSSTILKKLADFYEQEAISAVERLSILIEPMLIIVLGLGVGIFAFSIIEPMYSSLQSISQ